MWDIVGHLVGNWDDMLAGATILGIISHAVSNFPVPENKYGKWLLGTIQYAVGQRLQASATKLGVPSPVIQSSIDYQAKQKEEGEKP